MATVTESGECWVRTENTTTDRLLTQHSRYLRGHDDAEIGSATTVYDRLYGTITSHLRRGAHGPVTFTMVNTGTSDEAWTQHDRMLDYAEHNL